MNVFLVHGTFGKPFENWFPWLENELSKKEIKCVIPTFPTPEHQTYLDWEKLMDYYYQLGIINKDTVLIGHSCGSIFLVHYLISHKMKVKGLICVSGYNNYISGFELMDQLNSSFYVNEKDLSMKKYAENIFAFYGDDDPNVPQKYLKKFAESIAGEIKCVNKAGHFNADAGYVKCSDVIEAVIKCFS